MNLLKVASFQIFSKADQMRWETTSPLPYLTKSCLALDRGKLLSNSIWRHNLQQQCMATLLHVDDRPKQRQMTMNRQTRAKRALT